MPIPITSLDNRSFDDLVAEARQRLQTHLPEMQPLVEGDPMLALVDVFAWMTESVIYRANLIPERQRQAFLNLLHLPMRPAQAARGIVSIDTKPTGPGLPPLLRSESTLAAGEVIFSTLGELQSTPLAMAVMTKESVSDSELDSLGIPRHSLREIYGVKTKAFRPRSFSAGKDTLDLAHSQDKRFYLLLHLPDKKLAAPATMEKFRENLAGQIINIGIAPLDDQPAEIAESLAPRTLQWHIIWQKNATDRKAMYLPLEVIQDTSKGGRQTGVVRLRLPKSVGVLKSQFAGDPQYAGFGNTPPEQPAAIPPEQVVCWLSLTAPGETDLKLGYLGINAVDVIAQGVVRDQVIGIGDGRVGQVAMLNRTDVDAASLLIEVSEHGTYVPWQPVAHFAASRPDDRVYRFDSATGTVQFGDGIRGSRPAPNARIRAAYYRYGGGRQGNLPAGNIKQLITPASTQFLLRHEWRTAHGLDAETVAEAEQRIPAHLQHRNRAVTQQDFIQLARDNPIAPVGRAEMIPGLLPNNSLASVRFNVPGVASLFVMPPASPAFAAAPKPTAGLLRDVYTYMDERKLLGTELYVLSPEFISVALSLSVEVIDPGVLTETLNAVNQALLIYLWALAPGGHLAQGWPMGRALEVNELVTVAARVNGVLAVNHVRLFYQTQQGDWIETDKLSLQKYQLPEVMTVEAHEGEALPPPPAITSGEGSDDDDDAIAVPIIPELC